MLRHPVALTLVRYVLREGTCVYGSTAVESRPWRWFVWACVFFCFVFFSTPMVLVGGCGTAVVG